MKTPSLEDIYPVNEATWPPVRTIDIPGWCVREGGGGGQRVSSATATGCTPDIAAMEAAQAHLDQTPLVMIRRGEAALDAALLSAGYRIKDPVTVYLSRVGPLALAPPPVSAFVVAWPPVEIQKEIWAVGGIGAGRLAVMDRAPVPKCAILGRSDDQPAGTAFVAIHNRIAMLHALEVLPGLRRRGTARHVIHGAALWACDAGAEWLTVFVTTDNGPANALYTSLGMKPVGQYHYRIRQTH